MNDCLIAFLNALDEEVTSEKILDAYVEIGTNFIGAPSLFGPDSFYWQFIEGGVIFHFKFKKLDSVIIYCKELDGYNAYPHRLFKSFSNNANAEEIQFYLGTPFFKGVRYSEAVNRHITWCRYNIDNYVFHLEFDNFDCLEIINVKLINNADPIPNSV